MSAGFVHLHVHTEYSLLDGASRIPDLVEVAVAQDMPALAITDHGVMYGVIEFYEACRDAGIKPIIGCEVYFTPDHRKRRHGRKDATAHHLVLLCKDEVGYHNLIRIVTRAHLEGFYYRPRVDLELLNEHSDGLIAMSGCLASPICRAILADNYAEAKRWAGTFRDIFGVENFYLELQDHGLPEQRIVNDGLKQLSEELKLPLIATNDVHYTRRDDARAQDVLLSINTGSNVDDQDRLRFRSHEFYFKTPTEMVERFSDAPDAIARTMEVVERCNLEIPLGEPRMPHYQCPDGKSASEYLRELCNERLRWRYPKPSPEVRQRLEYELNVIITKGYAGYFLIVWDIVNYARNHGILVGPGRGSAAGSLVAYLLGITNIDPLKYGLMFERFLNPERQSTPDIDLDFPDNRRDEIFDYVARKYGEERVAQIVTFGTLQAKAAIRDVGRVLKLDPHKVDAIAKLIPERMSIEDALERSYDLQQQYSSDDEVRELIETAKRIEGLTRHASTHPCGVVIGDRPLIEVVPLRRGTDGKGVITQYDGASVEKVGLVKMDFLGLRNSTIISRTVELVKETEGTDVDINRIDLNDRKTYEMLSAGHSVGVFQLESRGMRQLLRDLQPDCFDHLVPLVALYRPGPMDDIPRFVAGRHGKPIEYMHPRLEPILRETFGVMLYQEQVMRVAHELAGFSMPQAEILMRAMGKKKIDLMEQMRPKFIEGAIANGINRETAERIFERMSAFARYAFNKSHSAAYALVAYQTAYLKANFPVAYMTCLLSVYKHFRSKIISALAECRRMGITILPPDINRSGSDFTVEGDAIRFGLSAIKNVGDAAAEAIVNERESNGPFRDILDFAQRISSQLVNRAALESLIKVGAFDQLHPNRNQLLATLAEERSPLLQALKSHRRTMPSQASLFDLSAELGVQTLLQLPDVPDAPLRKKWEWEQELLGFVLQRNLFEELPEVARRHITHEIGALAEQLEGRTVVVGGVVTSAKPIVDKRNRPMMFATLADHTGEVEVVLFSDVYQQYAQHLTSQALVLVSGKVRFRRAESGSEEIEHDSTIEPDVQVRLICEEVVPIEDLEARVAKSAQHISAAPAKKRKGRRRETSTQAQLTSQPARSSAPIKTLRVVLPPNRLTEQVLTRLRGIINAHKGSVPVELVIQNGSAVQRIALGASCCVDASGALRQELEALIGKGCVHTIT